MLSLVLVIVAWARSLGWIKLWTWLPQPKGLCQGGQKNDKSFVNRRSTRQEQLQAIRTNPVACKDVGKTFGRHQPRLSEPKLMFLIIYSVQLANPSRHRVRSTYCALPKRTAAGSKRIAARSKRIAIR